ncbi:MAG: DNA repair protein RadA [bacterium]|nr:DNA repair protein RadA [bacterium]
MAKKTTRYMCKECGAESSSWLGRCPQCGAWDSLTELARVIGAKAAAGKVGGSAAAAVGVRVEAQPLADVPAECATRMASGMDELDRVLGGGFVPGSVILVGGDPGIGKSTLLLQAAHLLADLDEKQGKVLYVSGEESPGQVRMRAERLDSLHPELYFLGTTELADVRQAIEQLNPRMVVLDSVQTIGNPELDTAMGSVAQVRHVTQALTRVAKERGFPLILIGHVTKEGQIAGPRMLEHMVDAVFYFEGEESGPGRILRSVKNRFGPTHEVALFEMSGRGLLPVTDPAGFLGGRHLKGEMGAAVTITFTGTRPLAVELQTLVSAPRYGTPARVVQGVDPKRVSLLLAVLEKSAGLELGGCDLFVQVAGGLKLDDPATDAALLTALASAHTGRPLKDATLFLGEVGLRGNLRPGSNLEERCFEAARLGFQSVIAPPVNGGFKSLPAGLVREVPDVRALLELSGALARQE